MCHRGVVGLGIGTFGEKAAHLHAVAGNLFKYIALWLDAHSDDGLLGRPAGTTCGYPTRDEGQDNEDIEAVM